MPSGTLTLNLRPVRFGFLVDPRDKAGLQQAIEINSVLWGGTFNPLIPVFEKIPASVKREYPRLSVKQWLDGHMRTFDPDIVVRCGAVATPKGYSGNQRTVNASDMLNHMAEEGSPSYGAGIFEVLAFFEHQELRFVRHQSLRFLLPAPEKKEGIFLNSVFGKSPAALEKRLDAVLRKFPGFQSRPCALKDLTLFLSPENLFLRRLSTLYANHYRRSYHRGDCLFFLDSSKTQDVIDYWNLRALGWAVVPIPKQVASDPEILKFASEFVDRNAWSYKRNPEQFNYTTLLKSRSVAESDIVAFSDRLRKLLKPARGQFDWKLTLQTWYPRIWDPSVAEYDGFELPDFDIQDARHDLGATGDTIDFLPILPEFTPRFSNTTAYCANEIAFRFFGKEELYAEVIPEGGRTVSQSFSRFSASDWRASRSGPVFFPLYKKFKETLRVPRSDSVFAAWMSEKDWTIHLSDKGRLARQIFKQVGGTYDLSLLCNHKLLNLIDGLSSKQAISEKVLRQKLWRIVDTKRVKALEPLISRLVEAKVLQLGLQLQCPICTRRSWYSVEMANYELQCHNCLEKFQLPSHTPSTITWSYRTVGPFSLPKMADGAYAVLLALRFFAIALDGATTTMLSFKATKAAREIEVDLGLFFQRSTWNRSPSNLVFVECKSHGRFDKKDLARLRALGQAFPRAVLVAATLNSGLTTTEVRLLQKLVARSRRLRDNGKPFNPILILTETELFCDFRLEETWEKKGGPYLQYQPGGYQPEPLVALSDFTQQIYLGLPPWTDAHLNQIRSLQAAAESPKPVQTLSE